MKELVIISGKGGTGKTSIAASLAVLAGRCMVADCDVDAADLHLVLSPRIEEQHEFRSGREAVIRQEDCIGCGDCLTYCRFEAVVSHSAENLSFTSNGTRYDCRSCDHCQRSCPSRTNEIIRAMHEASGKTLPNRFTIDPIACEGCGVCVRFCPEQAIDFHERLCGEWFVSETRCGPMVHARLGVAAENSGKLVSIIRRNARKLAEERGLGLMVVDGSPGIGCPVIASVTGAGQALVVTEPTPSGLHDLLRVAQLTRQLGVPTAVCINKWDLNPQVSADIETESTGYGLPVIGRIRYDQAATEAQIQKKTVIEYTTEGSARDIRALWEQLEDHLNGSPTRGAVEATPASQVGES